MGKLKHGFTLIETLVASATLVIFFSATALIIQTGIQAIGSARLRGEATRLAQGKLELIRNLTYENVGTVGGIPAGQLPPQETITVDGVDFVVVTSVLYVDDPFDEVSPADLLPTDYKRVKVAVSWSGMFASKQPLILLTDLAPKGLESAENTGTLSIVVFNAQGKPVSDASVHIEAAVTPAVNMDVTSDDNGKVLIPGAPTCTACYKISASKTGYSSDRTYGVDEIFHPLKPHLSILEGEISEISFAIDATATLVLRITRDAASGYSIFPGAQLIVQGSKEIGRTAADEPVYKVNRAVTAGTGGLVTVSNLEWDNYSLITPTGSSINFAGSWPFVPIGIVPGSTTNVTAIVKAASTHSLLLQLTNEERLPLVSAIAELSRDGIAASQAAGIEPNGDRSQIFFGELNEASYDLTITSPGYATMSSSVHISGDTLEYFMLSTESATPLP